MMKPSEAVREAKQSNTTTANCPACLGSVVSGVFNIPDHEYGLDYLAQYLCCAGCNTLYQSPMPGGQELSSFYPPHYHSMVDGGFLLRMRHNMRIERLKRL